MTEVGRKYVVGLIIILAVGGLIGWLYDQFVGGLLVCLLYTSDAADD